MTYRTRVRNMNDFDKSGNKKKTIILFVVGLKYCRYYIRVYQLYIILKIILIQTYITIGTRSRFKRWQKYDISNPRKNRFLAGTKIVGRYCVFLNRTRSRR